MDFHYPTVRKHEVTGKRLPSHLYIVWLSMKARCINPKKKEYKYYGGRGISIAKEWVNDFQVFAQWCVLNGWRKGLCLDRKDNSGDYTPDNCGFVTNRKNSQNTRRFNHGYSQKTGRKKFEVKIHFDKKCIYIGSFQTTVEAESAYYFSCSMADLGIKPKPFRQSSPATAHGTLISG